MVVRVKGMDMMGRMHAFDSGFFGFATWILMMVVVPIVVLLGCSGGGCRCSLGSGGSDGCLTVRCHLLSLIGEMLAHSLLVLFDSHACGGRKKTI